MKTIKNHTKSYTHFNYYDFIEIKSLSIVNENETPIWVLLCGNWAHFTYYFFFFLHLKLTTSNAETKPIQKQILRETEIPKQKKKWTNPVKPVSYISFDDDILPAHFSFSVSSSLLFRLTKFSEMKEKTKCHRILLLFTLKSMWYDLVNKNTDSLCIDNDVASYNICVFIPQLHPFACRYSVESSRSSLPLSSDELFSNMHNNFA